MLLEHSELIACIRALPVVGSPALHRFADIADRALRFAGSGGEFLPFSDAFDPASEESSYAARSETRSPESRTLHFLT